MRKKRKIGFYYLTLLSGNDVSEKLNLTLSHISNLQNIQRKINITGNKFGLLDSVNTFAENTRHQIVFKSAVHSFRPPLLSSLTVDERDSPKEIEEGEVERTHIVTKATNGDVILVLEKFLGSININQFIKYLNHFSPPLESDNHYKFGYEIIAKDDFLEEIANLTRVTCAEVYVDKQLLGSESLNYSERISSVKHEVMLTVKAKPLDSIIDFARDVYATFNGGENEVRKIRIIGRNDDNNEVKINTDFIERQEYVSPRINENTGEVLTDELLQEIEIVLYNF